MADIERRVLVQRLEEGESKVFIDPVENRELTDTEKQREAFLTTVYNVESES